MQSGSNFASALFARAIALASTDKAVSAPTDANRNRSTASAAGPEGFPHRLRQAFGASVYGHDEALASRPSRRALPSAVPADVQQLHVREWAEESNADAGALVDAADEIQEAQVLAEKSECALQIFR